MRFRIFSRKPIGRPRRWYFRGQADGNNEIILAGEGYQNHGDARATVEQIRREASGAIVDDSEWERRNR